VKDIEGLLDLIHYRPSKNRILLKPNIVVASAPERGDITHPKVIEALIVYFKNLHCEVMVAEGTGIFSTEEDFERLVRATGYGELRERLGVPMINLEQAETEEVPWRFGTIPLPKLLKDVEYINVPAMKTHNQTTVSLGVKNQKGLLPMRTRKIFHKKDLHACIRALSEAVQPALTVVDAIYCIEGRGPTGPPIGEVKRMDLVLAGKDMMAVDNVCSKIMGFDIGEIRHLSRVEPIQVLGESIENVRSPFKRAEGPLSRDPFVVYADDRTCTMCTVSFYKMLSKILFTPELYEQLGRRKDLEKIHIVMGGAKPPAGLKPCVLCLGDCSAGTARKEGLPHIGGCHPDYREMVNFLFPGTYPELSDRHSPS